MIRICISQQLFVNNCSLHPVVVYYHCEGVLTDVAFCILSDDLDHDVSFVYTVLHRTISYIKEELNLAVSRIYYFTDGCAAQYKNYKLPINLCHHFHDFSIECTWNFFSNSHGKSPCDVIGGTVKRLASQASLQRPTSDQILSAKEMFFFCKRKIEGIKFAYIPSNEIDTSRAVLATRFSVAKAIPGIRGYHQFVPVSESLIKMRRVSDNNEYDFEFAFCGGNTNTKSSGVSNIKASQYILCKYDGLYWIGITSEIDSASSDIKVKFMHPHFPSLSYRWPAFEDVCWVPFTHIITTIEAPSMSGRQYHISSQDTLAIQSLLSC